MSGERLAAHIEVAALIRRAEAAGGNAALLGRGDDQAGTILVLLAERGRFRGEIERRLTKDGRYRWSYQEANSQQKQDVNQIRTDRRRIDPDLWVVELDVPNAERFAAQIADEG